MTRHLFAALAAATLLLAACTSGDNPAPTPSPEGGATSEATPSLAPTTRAPFVLQTPTPTDATTRPPATIWLANIEDGTLTTLTEFLGTAPYLAEFTADGGIRVEYNAQGEIREATFDSDGDRLGDRPMEPSPNRCANSDEGARIDGRLYPDVTCGPISPDSHLMTYGVDGPAIDVNGRFSVPSWDQWVVDLESGDQRELQSGLRHCGGCDFRFGPEWSPSGRYLVVPELLDGGLVYLVDLETGIVRDITETDRATQLSYAPDWSPTSDRLLRPGPEGSTILEDLDASASRQLDDLPWPAAFDPTGTYAYAPAWATSTEPGPHQRTTIVDAATGETIGKRPGTPGWERIWDQAGDPIVATEGNFVAVLGNSEQCDGVLVYNPGRPGAACLEGAVAPAFSPDTTLVAFARQTTPASEGQDPVWEVAVFDRTTDESTVIAEGAVGYNFPALTWNEDGTRLLIRWPNVFGL